MRSLFLLAALILASCGLKPSSDSRTGWGVGPSDEQLESQTALFSDGDFGCIAQPDRNVVDAGENFKVFVTVFNAVGTVSIPGTNAVDTGGDLVVTTAYKKSLDYDVYWKSTLKVKDSTRSATCSFRVYVRAE